MTRHRIFTTSFASVYPYYVTKAEKKGRSRAEVDEIICWLTGYSPAACRRPPGILGTYPHYLLSLPPIRLTLRRVMRMLFAAATA